MADDSIHVLFVEDDVRIAAMTSEFLQRYQVTVTHVADGQAAIQESRRHRYDAVVLDVMLPGKSGLDVCREIRARSDVPVIIVSALGDEADRIGTIELGADDYLTKPFSARELLARIRAQVRRARGQLRPIGDDVRAGDLFLEPRSLRATFRGRTLALTSYEFSLLHALAERPGQVLTREQLLDRARHGGADDAFDRSIDVRIWKLRQKLGDDARNPQIVKTVRGVGYVLVTSE